MQKYCYLNGKIVPEDSAHISISDLGILRGYGVFDFLRTYNGKPFYLREHLDRLENSAKLVGLKVPISKQGIDRIINKLLKKNKLNEATVKIIVTGGCSADGLVCDLKQQTIIILVKEIHDCPAELYKKGIKLITFEHQRNNSAAKTIDYITMLKLQNQKQKQKAFEILYINKGVVLEGATSNFFIFKGNRLITSKNNILAGITRKIIIKLADKNFKVEVRDIKINEIKNADEAFITSTTREVLPVVKINNRKIGNGKVGKNTKLLMELFKKMSLGN